MLAKNQQQYENDKLHDSFAAACFSLMTMGEGQTLLNLNKNICKIISLTLQSVQQLAIATNVTVLALAKA